MTRSTRTSEKTQSAYSQEISAVLPATGTALVALPTVVDGLDQPSTRRNFGRNSWRWALAFVIGGGIAATVYMRPWVPAPLLVLVEVAKPGPTLRVLAVNGRIAAVQTVDVRSAVSGTLEVIPVAEGDTVSIGDVLARINPSSQEAIVRQAQAALATGRITLAQSEADFKRLTILEGIIPTVNIESADSKARAAAEDVRRLEAVADGAEIQLAKFTILAPIAGAILSVSGEPGQLIDPAMALFTLADLGQLVVEADVDEDYATQIEVGQPVLMQLAGETRTVDGHVSFVSGQVDAASGGLAVKIAFDAPLTAPLGMTVTANIVVERQDEAMTVPRTAIVSGTQGSSIFIVSQGIARRSAVTVVDWPAERLIVREGLQPGEAVITDAAGITDGQAVTLAAD